MFLSAWRRDFHPVLFDHAGPYATCFSYLGNFDIRGVGHVLSRRNAERHVACGLRVNVFVLSMLFQWDFELASANLEASYSCSIATLLQTSPSISNSTIYSVSGRLSFLSHDFDFGVLCCGGLWVFIFTAVSSDGVAVAFVGFHLLPFGSGNRCVISFE